MILRAPCFTPVGDCLRCPGVLLLILARHYRLISLPFASLPVRLTFRRPECCSTHPAGLGDCKRLLEAAHSTDHAMGTATPLCASSVPILCSEVTFVAWICESTAGKAEPAQRLKCRCYISQDADSASVHHRIGGRTAAGSCHQSGRFDVRQGKK